MRTDQTHLPKARDAARPRAARGFSLVEAMVSAGIVGVMLVASVNLFGGAAKTRLTDNNRRTALLLGHQLMSEVQQQQYKDESLLALLFGPELGENNRADFDDVDDYNNYRERTIVDRSGTPIPGYAGYERRVRVEWVRPSDLTITTSDTGLLRIEVKVADPRGTFTTIYGLKSEQAVPVEAQPTGTTWVQWTGVELEVGGKTPRRSTSGVNPVTQPPMR